MCKASLLAIPEDTSILTWYSSNVGNIHAIKSLGGKSNLSVDKVVQRQQPVGNRTAVRRPRATAINSRRTTATRHDMATPHIRRVPTIRVLALGSLSVHLLARLAIALVHGAEKFCKITALSSIQCNRVINSCRQQQPRVIYSRLVSNDFSNRLIEYSTNRTTSSRSLLSCQAHALVAVHRLPLDDRSWHKVASSQDST